MNTLERAITYNNKYIIRSEDNSIIITFEKTDNKFIIEQKDNHVKYHWIGTWMEYVDIFQLHYHYKIYGQGQVKAMQYLWQTKVCYIPGTYTLPDGTVHKDKWIFNKSIIIGSDCNIFYSNE